MNIHRNISGKPGIANTAFTNSQIYFAFSVNFSVRPRVIGKQTIKEAAIARALAELNVKGELR